MLYKNLVNEAKNAQMLSYSPYSNFKVGAVVLSKKGTKYSGANIENASYGLTICAERCAIFNALMHGATKDDFYKIAVTCDVDDFELAFPCGACRQVIAEFFPDHAEVIVSIKSGEYKIYKVSDLIPHAFRLQ